MSWHYDLKDVLDAIKGGMDMSKAVNHHGHSTSEAIFICVLCSFKMGVSVNKLIARHQGGQSTQFTCSKPTCSGSASYDSIQ